MDIVLGILIGLLIWMFCSYCIEYFEYTQKEEEEKRKFQTECEEKLSDVLHSAYKGLPYILDLEHREMVQEAISDIFDLMIEGCIEFKK